MSFTDLVLHYTRQIEGCLKKRGAVGKGLMPLARSVQSSLTPYLFSRIESIADVRNPECHHNDDYKFESDVSAFITLCEDVLIDLGVQPQKFPVGAMDTQTPIWVDKTSEWNRGGIYPSTKNLRLVFYYAGGVVDVKDEGNHRAGYGFPFGWLQGNGINAIGWVSVNTPGHVKVESSGKIITKNRIPVNIEFDLTIQVLDDDAAIERVAFNADAQQKLIVNAALAAFQDVIRENNHDYLIVMVPDVKRRVKEMLLIAQQKEAALPKEQRVLSFGVIEISIHNLVPTDPDIRDNPTKLEKIAIEEGRFDLAKPLREKEQAWNNQRTKDIAEAAYSDKKQQTELQIMLMEAVNKGKIDLKKIDAEIDKYRADIQASQDGVKLMQDLVRQLLAKEPGFDFNFSANNSKDK